MTTTPDPQTVRDFARQAILSSAEDVDYIGIAEQFSDDENWPADEDAAEAMHEAIYDAVGVATVTVSWSDEQQQDDGDPCAVCYCRGCTQCVNPSPPHEVCFCRKAFRAMAGKVAGGQPQDAQPERDVLAARVAELERELLALRGTELNPSPTILDAQSYGELRDEIAATMGDEWDLDEAEISILIKYVRWLAAGQPRDEDGYPIRRETYPAAEAVQPEPRPGHGPGVPGAMHLEAFGQSIADAFGDCPYHVGSSATSKVWRDVDVRLILDDERFAALFPGFANSHHIDAWWSLLCAALSELGRARTGLPIDFQIQSMTEANEKYHGIRNPLFLIHARDDHRPTMAAPQQPERGGEAPWADDPESIDRARTAANQIGDQPR